MDRHPEGRCLTCGPIADARMTSHADGFLMRRHPRNQVYSSESQAERGWEKNERGHGVRDFFFGFVQHVARSTRPSCSPPGSGSRLERYPDVGRDEQRPCG